MARKKRIQRSARYTVRHYPWNTARTVNAGGEHEYRSRVYGALGLFQSGTHCNIEAYCIDPPSCSALLGLYLRRPICMTFPAVKMNALTMTLNALSLIVSLCGPPASLAAAAPSDHQMQYLLRRSRWTGVPTYLTSLLSSYMLSWHIRSSDVNLLAVPRISL